MRRKLLTLALVASLPAATAGAIYKWTDKQGGVHYSDQPVPGASAIDGRSLSTYTPPPPPKAAPRSRGKPPGGSGPYSEVAIAAPANDATIRDNAGAVAVQITLSPALRPGDSVTLALDGQRQGQPFTATNVRLQNVARGTHTLQAQVLASDGTPVASSEPVTFHLKRTSQFFEPPASGAPANTGPVRQAPRVPMAPRAPRAPNNPGPSPGNS